MDLSQFSPQQVALNHAVSGHDLESAKRLLKAGVDPNFAILEGQTPLHLAIDSEIGWLRHLLEHGAEPNVKDSSGRTPLDWAGGPQLKDDRPT